MLSLVIPAYNEEQCIKHAYNVIQSLLAENNIEGEFIFVDDGSTDKTYETIKELSSQKDNIVGLHFSRNFGKESAISAGLAAVSGDCAVVIDCDLQHPPEKIIEMYRLWQQGYEIVEGNTKYSYVDENGETVEFYVPTYTVKCDKEELLNDRIEAVQEYKESDADVEKLREATGTPKAAAYFPLLQDGRVVYVFDEEDLKLAVADYFNDAKLYKKKRKTQKTQFPQME